MRSASTEKQVLAVSTGFKHERYRFLRCPFKISWAPEVFQKRNDQLLGAIEGVHLVFDDLIIGGKNDAEHDGILKQVLDSAY